MSSNAYDLKNTVKMHETCPVCGQPTEIETGFYYGTGYVSYALTVAFSIASFIAWWVIIGFSLDDTRFFWWMGVNAVVLVLLQPLIMRLSRSLWLSWFVKYDPDWKSNKIEAIERVVKEHQHNW
jgi:Na+-translocating ferredoxin:NAD+ oxidoreductase RnfA subunit